MSRELRVAFPSLERKGASGEKIKTKQLRRRAVLLPRRATRVILFPARIYQALLLQAGAFFSPRRQSRAGVRDHSAVASPGGQRLMKHARMRTPGSFPPPLPCPAHTSGPPRPAGTRWTAGVHELASSRARCDGVYHAWLVFASDTCSLVYSTSEL